jgi:hypothetical protein
MSGHAKGRLAASDDLSLMLDQPDFRRRIIACWNACECVKTEALEQYAEQRGWSKVMAERLKKRSDVRDELLAALREARPHLGIVFSAAKLRRVMDMVDTLLAKHKG